MLITTLSMVAGAQAHITLGDANAGNAPIPNANSTLSIVNPGSTGMSVTVDPVGGFILAATSPGTAFLSGSYHNGSVLIPCASNLTVTVTAAVLPVYLSP